MSLDDLATRAPRRRARECGVAFTLRVLPPDRATVLQAALANRDSVGNDEIADEVIAELAAVHPDCAEDAPAAFAVGRHRLGRCGCGRAS